MTTLHAAGLFSEIDPNPINVSDWSVNSVSPLDFSLPIKAFAASLRLIAELWYMRVLRLRVA